MKSSVLSRLIFLVAALHGHGHVSSAETNGGNREIGVSGWHEQQAENPGKADDRAVGRVVGRTVDRGTVGKVTVGKVVESRGRKIDGDDRGPEMSVTGDSRAAGPVDKGADEMVDDVVGRIVNKPGGEGFGTVGECVGKRFRKCR